MADEIKNCPDCEKNGKIVPMKKDKRQRPVRDSKVSSVYIGDDMWTCVVCGHVEEV